jgi:hypothetical protein
VLNSAGDSITVR